jgi:phenylpyruvate tautomerase PptA (4-oxalocrotonate tautomerase family)
MEMEQMLARLLKEVTDEMKEEIRTNQAKIDVNLKEMREEITGQAEMRSTLSAIEEKMEVAFHSLMAW